MGKEANILLSIILLASVERMFLLIIIYWVVKEVLFLILVAKM